MRAAVPFLISSLVFASLAVDFPNINNQNFVMSSATTQDTVSSRTKPKRNEPEGAKPVRGSGRRSSMEYPGSTRHTV